MCCEIYTHENSQNNYPVKYPEYIHNIIRIHIKCIELEMARYVRNRKKCTNAQNDVAC